MAANNFSLQLFATTSGGTVSISTGTLVNSGSAAGVRINHWDDGSLTFTNAAGVTRKIEANPQVNELLELLVAGAPGSVTTTGGTLSGKVWVK